ncbi:MAG: hypothetical protein JXB60_00790 [Candidatus Cloacimonetes bacterium]|nr:hypothetical protein [Candidatus Cloacimonadota bacterium]
MRNPRKVVIGVFLVAIFFTSISVASIIKSSQDESFQAFTTGIECRAQGDIMPEPFDTDLVAPVTPTEGNELFCSLPGGIAPRPWDDTDDDDQSGD